MHTVGDFHRPVASPYAIFVIQVLCTAFCVLFGIDRMVGGSVPAEVVTGFASFMLGLGILVVAIWDAEKPWWQGYY